VCHAFAKREEMHTTERLTRARLSGTPSIEPV